MSRFQSVKKGVSYIVSICAAMILFYATDLPNHRFYSLPMSITLPFSQANLQTIAVYTPASFAAEGMMVHHFKPKNIIPRNNPGFNLTVTNPIAPHDTESASVSLNINSAFNSDLTDPPLELYVYRQPLTNSVGLQATSNLSKKWDFAVTGTHQNDTHLDPTDESPENNNTVQFGLKYRY